MIFCGAISGILAGMATPGHILLFGEVINQFVYYSTATNDVGPRLTAFAALSGMNDSDAILCNRTQAARTLDMVSSSVNESEIHFCAGDGGSNIFDNVLDYICDPRDELISSVAVYSYYYLAIAVGVLIATFLANVLLNLSGYRQTRRIRLAFYRSVLSQEIGWFDVTESAQLSTRLAE